MSEWIVRLTQRGGTGTRFNRTPYVRRHTAIVAALDAADAARRAQKVLPGWTAVIVEKRS